MEWIWTTQEQHRLSVFRYMVRNKVTRLSDLMAEFKFSRYMVISVVDQLNEDIARLTGQTGVLVIEKGNVIVFDAPLNLLPIDELKQYYLSNSTRAQIIEHLIAEDFESWEDLAFDLGISTPTIYKERTIVQENLAVQGIEITKDYRLVGQEENIRFLTFALLTVYNGQRTADVADEIKNAANYYISHVIAPIFGELKDSQISIIWHMAAIWTNRFSQRHFVSSGFTNQYLNGTIEMSEQAQRLLKHLKVLMARNGHMSDGELDNEARFIILILHSLGLFSTIQTARDVTPTVKQCWQRFDESIQTSYKCLFRLSMTPVDSRKLTYSVGHTLFQFLIYPFGISSGIYDLQHFEEFSERYPLAFQLGTEILNDFAQKQELDSSKLKTALLTDLVSALATGDYIYQSIPNVNIVLDFGNHVNIENLLLDQFGPVTKAKIATSHRLDNQTDILLTDVPRKPVTNELVYVWQGIESDRYLNQLIADINRISSKKFNAWRRQN